jgi:hypothetical protein
MSIVVPEGDAPYLRMLNNAREQHVGEQTALLNQLQQLAFLIFPEFKTVLKNMKGKTAQHILKRYTTPERITTLSKEVLGEEMRKRSMGKFGVSNRPGAGESRNQRERLWHFHGHKAYPDAT